jgi:hypothetical protein
LDLLVVPEKAQSSNCLPTTPTCLCVSRNSGKNRLKKFIHRLFMPILALQTSTNQERRGIATPGTPPMICGKTGRAKQDCQISTDAYRIAAEKLSPEHKKEQPKLLLESLRENYSRVLRACFFTIRIPPNVMIGQLFSVGGRGLCIENIIPLEYLRMAVQKNQHSAIVMSLWKIRPACGRENTYRR